MTIPNDNPFLGCVVIALCIITFFVLVFTVPIPGDEVLDDVATELEKELERRRKK